MQMIKRIENLMRKNNIEIQDEELFEYGCSLLLNYTITILVILGIGLYLNITLDILVFCLVFLVLRSSTGGYHTESKYSCFFLSIAVTILVPLLLKCEIIPLYLLMLINVMMFCIILMHLPIENKNKPLSINEKDYYRKRAISLYIIDFVILGFLSLVNITHIALVFSVGMLTNSISVGVAIIQKILYKHN